MIYIIFYNHKSKSINPKHNPQSHSTRSDSKIGKNGFVWNELQKYVYDGFLMIFFENFVLYLV